MYPWPDNVNFRKKFSDVLRFCALLMTSLILGVELGEPKIRSLCCFSVWMLCKNFERNKWSLGGNSDTAKKINSRPKVKQKPDQVSHMSSPGGLIRYTVHTDVRECERRPFPGVCWCLKKEWVHMDVFRTGWRQKGQPATKTSAPIYLSWKVLFFHSSSFITIPSPVWDGHGGMVLNTKYEEGKWRGKLANRFTWKYGR